MIAITFHLKFMKYMYTKCVSSFSFENTKPSEDQLSDHRWKVGSRGHSLENIDLVVIQSKENPVLLLFKKIHILKFICLLYFWLHWVFVATWAFSSCGEQEHFTAVLLIAMEHTLWACRLQGLRHVGSGVVPCRLRCSVACRIFLDQGSNPCPLHWQADSYPLGHQGSPI